MSNHILRQNLRHATVKYLAKPGCPCRSCKTWHDDAVPIKKERGDDDDDARARVPIKRERQSDDDDAAVWVQSDDDGDESGGADDARADDDGADDADADDAGGATGVMKLI